MLSYEYMEIIYENCQLKNCMKEDHRSYRCNFCSWEKKAWKKTGCTGIAEVCSMVERCTGVAAVKLEFCTSLNFFAGFLFATAKVASITAMIFFRTRVYVPLNEYVLGPSQSLL